MRLNIFLASTFKYTGTIIFTSSYILFGVNCASLTLLNYSPPLLLIEFLHDPFNFNT